MKESCEVLGADPVTAVFPQHLPMLEPRVAKVYAMHLGSELQASWHFSRVMPEEVKAPGPDKIAPGTLCHTKIVDVGQPAMVTVLTFTASDKKEID